MPRKTQKKATANSDHDSNTANGKGSPTILMVGCLGVWLLPYNVFFRSYLYCYVGSVAKNFDQLLLQIGIILSGLNAPLCAADKHAR